MPKQKKTIKEEMLENIKRNRLNTQFALFFREFENVMPKSRELEALGMEKIARAMQVAFLVVVPEIIKYELQRFIEETVGKMYRNAVLSDKYPDLAKESKIKFEAKQEIEKKMKQWLKENL